MSPQYVCPPPPRERRKMPSLAPNGAFWRLLTRGECGLPCEIVKGGYRSGPTRPRRPSPPHRTAPGPTAAAISGARNRSGPGLRRARAPARPRRPWRATESVGCACRSPRAAVNTSTASTRDRPSTARRNLRAADHPIETWSSCIADDGIESTLAGAASRLSPPDDARLRVLGDHVPAVDARIVRQERIESMIAGDVQKPVGAPLADHLFDAREGRKRIDEPDVGSLWGFDGQMRP